LGVFHCPGSKEGRGKGEYSGGGVGRSSGHGGCVPTVFLELLADLFLGVSMLRYIHPLENKYTLVTWSVTLNLYF
jgi:hypothetical protein